MRLGLMLALLLTPATPHAIPETRATSLDNTPIHLPDDLRGHPAILVLGFSKSAREPVTQWGRRLAADYRDSPTVLYYEMPVLAEIPRLFRGMVVNSIRQSVPRHAQSRLVPITDHADQWKQLAGFNPQDRPDAAYVLLIDPAGTILSRHAEGPPDDLSYSRLRHSVERATQSK